MKSCNIFLLTAILMICAEAQAQVEEQRPHFNVKGVSIGISAPDLIDIMMVTMPGLGSNAKTMINLQSVKTYMMPPRKASAQLGMTYTIASCLEFYSNFEKNYKANLSPEFIGVQASRETSLDIRNALKFLVTDGTISADVMPYGSVKLPENAAQTARYKLNNYLHVFNPSSRENAKVFEVQKALMRGNPVIVELKVPEDFEKLRNTKFWTSIGDPLLKTYHFLVVSYNLDLEAFEVQGSWGREWGSDGYLWIDFNDFSRMAQNGYVMVPEERVGG
jgi:hypothetical protein